MENQVIYLTNKGFNAESFNSTTDYDKRDEIIEDLQKDPSPIQFLYLTPEMFVSNYYLANILRDLIARKKITMVVADEAHMIEDKKFERETFLSLPKLREELPDVQWVALTTISQSMLPSLKSSLKMIKPVVVKAPTARENIFYDVIVTKDSFAALKKTIKKFTTREGSSETSGIVYVGSISNTDRFANFLKAEGFNAESYYADKPDRFEIQEKWMHGDIDILVATAESFGFGIVRNSVKFVIHMSLPLNMRAMYQVSNAAIITLFQF
jgi:ATP-dependent DNA helicase RecQ